MYAFVNFYCLTCYPTPSVFFANVNTYFIVMGYINVPNTITINDNYIPCIIRKRLNKTTVTNPGWC